MVCGRVGILLFGLLFLELPKCIYGFCRLMESHDPTADDERAGFWFKLIHSRIFNV